MSIQLAPPYHDLTFMSPLSEQRAERLVRFLSTGLHGTVLDVGCGWAELLLRVVASAPHARGIGIDLDEEAIAHGRRLATARALSNRLTLVVADAKTAPDQVDAVVCIGASQVWGDGSTDNQPLDYAGALGAIRRKVHRGARVVYGEGIWSRPPSEQAIAPLGQRLDEFVTLAELVDIAEAQSFMPLRVEEANIDEWDEFESGYCACYASWLAEHDPGDPDAPRVRELASRQRDGYLRGYRGILGFAYLCLCAV